MATKKKSKKGESVINRGNTPLTAADVKKFSKLLEEIGSRRKKGFVMIFETDTEEKKNGTLHTGSGLAFSNCARGSFITAVGRTIRAMDISPFEVLLG